MYTHGVWAADELFRDDVDRMVFLRELVRAGAKVEWDCLAFCLMDTHYHLLLEVDDGALPRGMHSLNFRYAGQFNDRHAMKGHVMGARYDSVRIEDDEHLLNAFKYVVLESGRGGPRAGSRGLALEQLCRHGRPGRAAHVRRGRPRSLRARHDLSARDPRAPDFRRRVVTVP